jgi:hypothetical protein
LSNCVSVQTIESVFGDDDDDDESEEEIVRQQTKRMHPVNSKLTSSPAVTAKNGKTADRLDSSHNTGSRQRGSSPPPSNNHKIELNDEEKQELIVC